MLKHADGNLEGPSVFWRYHMSSYEKNLLEQLRLVVLTQKDSRVDDMSLTKALTANENIRQLGYCLSPKGLVALAKSEELDGFYDSFRKMIPDVKAEPMYPDFPNQVMAIDEAQFRFHQICHYMSTYGVEMMAELFGQDYEVTRGWMPEVERTEKTEKDTALLEAKTLEVLSKEQKYSRPLEILLQKSERMTAQEIEIVQEALKHVDVETIDLDIPFKQNMIYVFNALFNLDNREAALKAMRNLCQHTGDVLKCIDYVLTRNDYHFRTAQKRQLVNLIETYPVYDWKANVILTNKKARRTILVLQYLSYSRFSSSKEHMEVVRALRNGELSTWESQVKTMLSQKDEKVIDFIAERPGMMLRWVNWLLKLGYEGRLIEEKLAENAEDLSTKTLVITAGALGRLDEKKEAFEIIVRLLERKLKALNTPLKGAKVFVDEGRLDLKHSVITAKNDEAGYVRNGLAYHIPENVKIIRFFVYWNDKNRVDIDLHASANNSKQEGISVGWDMEFRDHGIVHSGDITHSNAAEYIDLSMDADLNEVQFNVNLYAGKPSFDQIDECFIGLLAVAKANEKVKLYNPENCFFYNDIRTKTRTLHYGYINLPQRYLCLDGNETPLQWMDGVYSMADHKVSQFTVDKYIELLLRSQQAVITANREEANIELVMEKPQNERQISLIDNNFFM